MTKRNPLAAALAALPEASRARLRGILDGAKPGTRNPMARELASPLYAARIVPPRKGKGAHPKRQSRRVTEEC